MDYYTLLGVEKDADIKTIRRAYRRTAFKYHPDRHPPTMKKESELK